MHGVNPQSRPPESRQSLLSATQHPLVVDSTRARMDFYKYVFGLFVQFSSVGSSIIIFKVQLVMLVCLGWALLGIIFFLGSLFFKVQYWVLFSFFDHYIQSALLGIIYFLRSLYSKCSIGYYFLSSIIIFKVQYWVLFSFFDHYIQSSVLGIIFFL